MLHCFHAAPRNSFFPEHHVNVIFRDSEGRSVQLGLVMVFGISDFFRRTVVLCMTDRAIHRLAWAGHFHI
jgi:hypothetical protein